MNLKFLKKILVVSCVVYFTSITTCCVHAEDGTAVAQAVDVKEESPEIIKEGEEVRITGITRKNKMTIYQRCVFDIKEGQTFYIEYCDSVSGNFEVGLIDNEGNKLETDTILREENDVASIQVDKEGLYYFYFKGANNDAGLFNTTFKFDCCVHAEDGTAITQAVDVTEEASEIIKEDEEVRITGITRKNKMTIYQRCVFDIKEGQTFYIEYCDSVSGNFEVGLIDNEGNKLETDTILREENDVASIQVDKEGLYYFYFKGANNDAGLFNTTFKFDCYFK